MLIALHADPAEDHLRRGDGEKTVSELLAEVPTTQPNMSQHLRVLYRSGVLSELREGLQIYYTLQSERVATLCRAVCMQVQAEFKAGARNRSSDQWVLLLAR